MSNVPSIWLEFDENGAIDAGIAAQLTALLGKPGIEDLVVMSHGWKNDKNDATKLYGTLWANAAGNLPAGRADKIVVAGVLWPAKAFQTDFDAAAITDVGTPGTLSASGGTSASDLPQQEFDALLADFARFMGPSAAQTIAAARTAAQHLNPDASHDLAKQAAAAAGVDAHSPDKELRGDATRIARAAADRTEAQFLLGSLTTPPVLKLAPKVGGAMGLSSAVHGFFTGARAAVGRFLNQLTYYEMKKRAGVIGVSLIDKVLGKLTPSHPIRVHLVGHSFGGRLVTAAANRWAAVPNLELFSLTILQGAYSHNAMSHQVAGAFPNVVGKPTGPIAITHTHNDLACTLAYAIASRFSRDTTQGVGDASDEFGAMGANGPQKLEPGASEPDNITQVFAPKRGKVNTFLADAYILKTNQTDAHNNVTNAVVGQLLASVIQA
ncbi:MULTISPECIES: hypothetical protein [Bradyrhizobium]|uniref:hypothetical protein n=1 Tax=Bradyrhizobium TaxID=374 RepID=UPI001B8A6A24|nr:MULTISPECIES: hypothetical protein [Bradyrhizobium]MBR0974633.1 hypothetical protein [Bradyrhizobium japonicum]